LCKHCNNLSAQKFRIPLLSKIYMKKYSTALIVSLIMLSAILGITNPGFKAPHQFFDDVEGKVIHNYFIFSVYQQYSGFTTSKD
jgi:hypothetical protein